MKYIQIGILLGLITGIMVIDVKLIDINGKLVHFQDLGIDFEDNPACLAYMNGLRGVPGLNELDWKRAEAKDVEIPVDIVSTTNSEKEVEKEVIGENGETMSRKLNVPKIVKGGVSNLKRSVSSMVGLNAKVRKHEVTKQVSVEKKTMLASAEKDAGEFTCHIPYIYQYDEDKSYSLIAIDFESNLSKPHITLQYNTRSKSQFTLAKLIVSLSTESNNLGELLKIPELYRATAENLKGVVIKQTVGFFGEFQGHCSVYKGGFIFKLDNQGDTHNALRVNGVSHPLTKFKEINITEKIKRKASTETIGNRSFALEFDFIFTYKPTREIKAEWKFDKPDYLVSIYYLGMLFPGKVNSVGLEIIDSIKFKINDDYEKLQNVAKLPEKTIRSDVEEDIIPKDPDTKANVDLPKIIQPKELSRKNHKNHSFM
jgi:hypothetical protein